MRKIKLYPDNYGFFSNKRSWLFLKLLDRRNFNYTKCAFEFFLGVIISYCLFVDKQTQIFPNQSGLFFLLFNSAIFCKLAVLKKHSLCLVEIELSVPFSPHFANTFSVICNHKPILR